MKSAFTFPVAARKACVLCLFFMLMVWHAYGQGCNCPAVSSCGPCTGGLTNLVLNYDGGIIVSVTASDDGGVLASSFLSSTITINSRDVGEAFDGNVSVTVTYVVGVEAEIFDTSCSLPVYAGQVIGNFTVLSGESVGGGTLCCSQDEMDNIAPPDIDGCPIGQTVSLSAGCTVPVSWSEPTAESGCGNPITLTSNFEPGDPFPVGITTVQYTATDEYGNTSTCSFDVTVEDNIDPIFSVCNTADIVASANSTCKALVNWTEPIATDNCSVSLTRSHVPGTQFDIGTTLVTYTATDGAGNTASCSFNVIVEDNTNPVITNCPTNRNVAVSASSCTRVVSWTEPSATDNCDGSPALTSDHNSGEAFPLGVTTVTYTAEDDAGNTTTCFFTVTVVDNTPPVITGCPSDVTVLGDASCNATATWTPPTASDNCTVTPTLTSPHTPGQAFALGETIVTYTATDASNNTSTCTFRVIVLDNTPPMIANCPSTITVNSNTSSCGTTVNWTAPTSSDNCSVASFTSTHNPGSTFAVGTTTVIYTATDGSGNVGTCSFDVIVNDVTLPVISNCPADRTVTLASTECAKVVTWTPPSASDNCPTGFTFTSTHNSGDSFPFGTTEVIYTATDASGNTATCSFDVTVLDNTDPQIAGCSHGAIQEVTATAACNAIPVWTPPTATDNCAVTLTSTHNLGDVFPLGKTDVTYTATDQAGNTANSCTFKIHVKDKTAPVLAGCISADIVEEANGSCEAVATWIEPTASDNCSVTLTKTHSPGNVFPMGTTVVTYTATDGSGNITSCSFNVVVKDEIPPVISGCISSDVIVTADGSCGAVATWNEPTASDDCTVTLISTHSPGNTFSLGTTIVTYTATDNSGNTATCSFNVIVKDETAPVISGCTSDITASTTSESCEAAVSWPELTVSDNCLGATLSSTHSPGDVFPKGTTEVKYTATDGSGNTTTCTFNVIVTDETDPEFDDLVESDIVATANDNGEVIVSWDEITCFDNCGAVTLTSSHDPGTDFPIGTTEVTYTATDAAGNTKVYSFNVIVEDKTNPVISGCSTSDIIMEATGSCEAMVTWTPPSSSDNSGNVTLTGSHDPGEFFPLGRTTVTYTATDPSGNSSICQFNVVVTDETAPVITDCVADITVSATASCSAIANWTPPTVTDNCSVTFTSSHLPGTVFETGTTEVTYTVSDDMGNTSTCKFNVIVKDEAAPVIRNCQSSDITTTTTASCSAIVSWPEPTAEDCSEFTLTRSHSPGTTFPVGTTEVAYIAEDIHGNSTFCKFNVVVEDKMPPVFSNCQEKVIVKANAACNATVSWPVPDVTDNCEVATLTSTHNPGDAFTLGTTEVKYTATDIYGNISHCLFQVVVENVNPPVIEGCVENIVAKAGESGEVQIDWVPPTATVQCGAVTLTGSHAPGDSFPIGTTTVEYRATDDAGNISLCTFTVNVSYEEVQFDMVNVLTPDGDGINDEWTLGNIEKFSQNRVVIVDRWGSVIFSATGYNNTNVVWKGNNGRGTIVPTGTYFYTISVRIGTVVQEKTGFIELIQ